MSLNGPVVDSPSPFLADTTGMTPLSAPSGMAPSFARVPLMPWVSVANPMSIRSARIAYDSAQNQGDKLVELIGRSRSVASHPIRMWSAVRPMGKAPRLNVLA